MARQHKVLKKNGDKTLALDCTIIACFKIMGFSNKGYFVSITRISSRQDGLYLI